MVVLVPSLASLMPFPLLFLCFCLLFACCLLLLPFWCWWWLVVGGGAGAFPCFSLVFSLAFLLLFPCSLQAVCLCFLSGTGAGGGWWWLVLVPVAGGAGAFLCFPCP